jgi:hypothetical protein
MNNEKCDSDSLFYVPFLLQTYEFGREQEFSNTGYFKTSHFLNSCSKTTIQNVSFIVFLRTAAVMICPDGHRASIR